MIHAGYAGARNATIPKSAQNVRHVTVSDKVTKEEEKFITIREHQKLEAKEERDFDIQTLERHEMEKMLYIALDKLERDVTDCIDDLERRTNEKFEQQRRILEKDAEILKERLEAMNQFREQINVERSKYVTKDQLELTIKALTAEIKPLEEFRDFNKGKGWAASNNRDWLAIILGGLAGIAAFIAIFMK